MAFMADTHFYNTYLVTSLTFSVSWHTGMKKPQNKTKKSHTIIDEWVFKHTNDVMTTGPAIHPDTTLRCDLEQNGGKDEDDTFFLNSYLIPLRIFMFHVANKV